MAESSEIANILITLSHLWFNTGSLKNPWLYVTTKLKIQVLNESIVTKDVSTTEGHCITQIEVHSTSTMGNWIDYV